MITLRFCLIGLLLVCIPAFAANPAGEFPGKDSPEGTVYRGSIVFQSYCMQCHGVTAEGNGRKAKLYNPPPYNLRRSMMPDAYKAMIIRKGGKAVGRSEFMPPWGQELTDEQIEDVVSFLRSIAPPDAAK